MANTVISYEERRNRILGRLLIWPAAFWLVVFFALPLVVVLVYSFLTPDQVTQVKLPLTLDGYLKVADPVYTGVIVRSIMYAVETTVICLLLGYPLAFFVATRPRSVRNFFLLLVVIPFWTNFLVRTYAWLFILSNNGLINSLLVDTFNILSTPIKMINTPFAVVVGLIYGNLPFMILPIYASVEKFNFRLVEAVHDLGGNDWHAFWRVVLPITMPGVVAGSILVFIPSLGAYVVPDMLGGTQGLMIGMQITDAVRSLTRKPFGGALSIVMMVVVSIALLIYFRFSEQSQANQGR